MRFSRWARRCLLLTALAGLAIAAHPFSSAQDDGAQMASAASRLAVQDVSFLREPGRIGVRILTSRPMLPQVSQPSPNSIVIEAPGTFAAGQRVISGASPPIVSVRVAQFRNQPPGTRIQVQLAESLEYSLVASGNQTVLWLLLPTTPSAGPAAGSQAQPDAASPTQAMEQVSMPAGSSVNAPTTVNAAADTTIINLPRGGQVHVCPNTALSVTTSQNGRNLMLGMSTGALETHYTLPLGAADIILTPDLRILLPGPGTFAFAVSADHQGNTCVRALEGNTASLVISELMGDDNAQVGPNEQVVFRSGRVKNVSSSANPGCGCPRPVVPVLQAAQPSTPLPPASAATPRPAVAPDTPASTPPSFSRELATASAPVNPKRPHVEVEAPFVFRASEAAAPPPAVAHLRLASETPAALRDTQVQPPALVSFYRVNSSHTPPKPSRGVFGRLRSFFGGMFR